MPSHEHTLTCSVTVLGSGSQGNSIAVRCGDSTLLVDAGFSARDTIRRLDACGIDAASINAILLTHEHGDHVRGIRVLAKRLDVPVYASPGTRRAAKLEELVDDPRDLQHGYAVTVGEFEVIAFRTSHDAADPVGLRFESRDGTVIGIATDTGEFTPEACEALTGCTILGIESNHDIDMLTSGPYPWFLKQRILSTRGHLSNVAAAEALETVAHDGLSQVIALHLSTTNNEAPRARTALTGVLSRLELTTQVVCAHQNTPPSVE